MLLQIRVAQVLRLPVTEVEAVDEDLYMAAVDVVRAVNTTNNSRAADAAAQQKPAVLIGYDLNPILPH